MPQPGRQPIYLAFFCSGAAALIYETSWTRQLGLSMGHTVAAAGSVLAAFMGGLAIGAALAGRFAPRLDPTGALRAFAKLEILIAASALALPLEIAALRPLLALAYADGAGGLLFALTRITTAVVVVTIPAIAMGATLPLLVRWTGAASSGAASTVARLYASNAIGATVGAVLAGFVLLPAIGLRFSTFIAVVLNVVSASIAWRVSRKSSGAPIAKSKPASVRRLRVAVPIALALSGAASLILQLVWTRLLSMLVGPTTYAFSTMVASFIAGIALGSLAGGWLGRRGPSPSWLAVMLLLSGIAGAVAATWAPEIALASARRAAESGSAFTTTMWLQSMVIAGSMLPMTFAFGAAFPLAVGVLVGKEGEASAEVAGAYAANTIGAITGALAGAYLLIPLLGLQGSVRVAALVTAIAAVVAIAPNVTGWRRILTVTAAGAAMAAIWLTPPWDRALLSSGAYKYAAFLPVEHSEALLRAGSLLYYREGAASTVSVRRQAGVVSLAIDGKIDASNGGDMLTQRLLAHLPLLLHPNPKRVAIIGLGSGVTLGSALTHPIDYAETIELSPEVIEAASHFDLENGRAPANPRARLIAGDGRTHMMLGAGTYDVVVSEPSNPWMAGVAGLFTREMFHAIRERLSADGIACQWAHAYDMSASDLRSIAATFTDVFPHALLVPIGDDVLLIGSGQSIEARLPSVRTAWQRPGVAADLASVRVTTPDLLLSLVATTETGLKEFAAGAEIQVDDRLALEFTAPRSAFGRTGDDAVALLRSLERTGVVPATTVDARRLPGTAGSRGAMLVAAEAFEAAMPDLVAALENEPGSLDVVDNLILAAAPAGELDEAERQLRRALTRVPAEPAAAIGLSRILASRGDFAAAEAVLRPYTSAGATVAVLDQLASVFADSGDAGRLESAVVRLQSIAPAAEPTAYYAAVLHVAAGRPNEALRLVGDLRTRGGLRSRDLTAEATALAALGRRDEARQTFAAATALAPREAGGYENLGTFEADSGNDRAAAGQFAEALILDPASPVARAGLAAALRRLR